MRKRQMKGGQIRHKEGHHVQKRVETRQSVPPHSHMTDLISTGTGYYSCQGSHQQPSRWPWSHSILAAIT